MSTHSVRAELLGLEDPPMPDFSVRRHGDTWVIEPLTGEARLFCLEEIPVNRYGMLGNRIVLDGLDELVPFLDELFDAGLRCI